MARSWLHFVERIESGDEDERGCVSDHEGVDIGVHCCMFWTLCKNLSWCLLAFFGYYDELRVLSCLLSSRLLAVVFWFISDASGWSAGDRWKPKGPLVV